uniref:Uncharacterized protein n=1 Tax=Chromera velia CCMP2878 TaxID=1169474 RepID=A0A0G4HH05_9ALVE|eukprot:Cvel_27497.t1-p1 / transcript=Cvel_27497.t1 / gene=Cvel_27497 / organism=Chromera_velia_CCMP2878 / gene_product=hypothetical protein / transcript_product=hypothetical protein / location=Cvel_scaffold3440:77-4851(-) / protein_length=918 / sequence_SO=supercontig / SO=protein_coding / is_pseudo=false
MDLETSRNEVANRNPEGPTRTWCYQACWEAYAGILGAQVLFMIYFFGIEDFVSSCLSLVQIVTALLVLWKRQFSFLGITCVVASVLFGVLVAIAAGALGEVSVPYIVAVGELGMVATEKSRKLAMLVGASVVAGVMVLHNLVMMTLGQFRERDQILKGQTMRRIEKTADDVQELAGRGAGAMMMQAASFRRSVTALSAASYQAMGLNRRLSSGAAFEGGSSDVGLDLETAGRGREKDRHRPSLGTVLEGAEGEETEAVPAPPSSFLSYRQQTAGSRLGLGEVGEGGGGIGEGEGEPPQPSLQKTEQRQRWSSSLLPPPRVSLDREGDRERTAKDEEDKKALHDKANEEEKGKDTAAEEAKKQAESHPRPPFGDKQTSGPSDLPKITREQVQAGTSALHSLLGPTALESPRHSSQQEEESEEEEESDEEESEESEEEEEAEEPSRPQSNREKKEGEKEEKEKPGERADTAAVPKEKEKENLSRLNSARRDRDAPAQEPKSAEEKEKEGKDRGIKQEVPPPPHRQSSQAHRDGDRRGGAAATNEAHARRDSFWTPLAEQPPFASTDALGGPRGPPGGEALPRGSAEVEVEEGPPHAPEQRRESGEVPGPSGLLIGAGGICEGGGNGRLGPNYGTISQASRSPPIPPLTGASFPGHNGGTATERSPPTPGGTSRAESPLSRAAPFQSLGGGSVAAGLSSPSRGPNRSVTSSALRRRRDEQRRDSSAPLEPPATRTGEEHDPPPRAFSPATREAMRHSPAPRARAPVPHESLARETFLSVALQGQAERERQPRDPSRGRPQTLQQQKEILMSHILKGEKGGIVPRLFSSESAAPPANDATDASATGRGADHDREAGVGEGGQGLREREGASQGQSLAAVTPPRASAPLQLGEMASITGGFTPPSLRLAGDGNDAAPRRDRRR